MSVIERDITTEEANTFVRSVAHRLEMYSIAEQIHFAKSPFANQCAQNLPKCCIHLKRAFIELMVLRSSIAECSISKETAFDDLIPFLDSSDPSIKIPIFALSDMPHLSSHEDIRVGISMIMRSIIQNSSATGLRDSALFLEYNRTLYPRLQIPVPIVGRDVQPRRSSTTSLPFIFGRLLALSLAFNVQVPDVLPDDLFAALCGGRYFLKETLSIFSNGLELSAGKQQSSTMRPLYKLSPIIVHQALRVQPSELSQNENDFYQKHLLDVVRDDVVSLANISNTISSSSIDIQLSTEDILSALHGVEDFPITEYNQRFKLFFKLQSKSDVLKLIRKTQDSIRSGEAFVAFYREVRTGFRTVFTAPLSPGRSSSDIENTMQGSDSLNSDGPVMSLINTSALKWYCEIDALLDSMAPSDLKRLLVHPLKITPTELSQCITPQRSNLRVEHSIALQTTVESIKGLLFSLEKDSHELLSKLVIEATGFPYLTGVSIQVGDGPKPYLLPMDLAAHTTTHPTWARLMGLA
ncbi:hypothetical protein GL50803_0060748 [Giardia duodenalis]|uniref:Uncharacterized protein n=2 Tax=Giardia intestinalis TaxID=5741 RepID=A0A644F693_GIAIC|nr:hypothetical protein GL50803_0060748 [Giardia intestinalis]KAE8304154.1 hypothetical protein GL50803_0060748 [Giardia intestinalis]